MHFDMTMAKTKFRFWIFGLFRVWGDDVVWRHAFFFLKDKFVQKESSGTCFDHGQFEIKTLPIYARPNVQNSHSLIKSQ